MSSNIEKIINGENPQHPKPPQYTEEQLYWLMHEEGKKRFGSECRHDEVKDGYCLNCLRKVISK